MVDFDGFYEGVKAIIYHSGLEEPFVKMIDDRTERYKQAMKESEREKTPFEKVLEKYKKR